MENILLIETDVGEARVAPEAGVFHPKFYGLFAGLAKEAAVADTDMVVFVAYEHADLPDLVEEWIRTWESGYAPVIVIVTSEDTFACRSRAEEAGTNGFVPKSDNLSVQLKSTLDNLFSGNGESLPADLVEAGHRRHTVRTQPHMAAAGHVITMKDHLWVHSRQLSEMHSFACLSRLQGHASIADTNHRKQQHETDWNLIRLGLIASSGRRWRFAVLMEKHSPDDSSANPRQPSSFDGKP